MVARWGVRERSSLAQRRRPPVGCHHHPPEAALLSSSFITSSRIVSQRVAICIVPQRVSMRIHSYIHRAYPPLYTPTHRSVSTGRAYRQAGVGTAPAPRRPRIRRRGRVGGGGGLRGRHRPGRLHRPVRPPCRCPALLPEEGPARPEDGRAVTITVKEAETERVDFGIQLGSIGTGPSWSETNGRMGERQRG